jgi:hypothetical protein
MKEDIITRIKKIFLEIGKEREKEIAKGRLIEIWEPDLLKMVKAKEPLVDIQKIRQAVLLAGKKEIEIHNFPNDVYEQHYRFYFKKTKEEIRDIPKIFEIQVKDRNILVNNYLLSKPHAVGSNFEFFEYIRSKSANTKIERNSLPDFGGLSLKQEVKNKSFIKILNELGFKGEILKAFFPKRGKDMLVYRGDKITKKDLEKVGVKIPLFLKELELAHLKNSPE